MELAIIITLCSLVATIATITYYVGVVATLRWDLKASREREEVLESLLAQIKADYSQLQGSHRALQRQHHETGLALQDALGGGWQLADPQKDIFFLPESSVLEFDDHTSGGGREQMRREISVEIVADQDLMDRLMKCDYNYLPVAFRGLEWKLKKTVEAHEVYSDFTKAGFEMFAYAATEPKTTLSLETIQS